MSRILIAYADTGGGHRAAALAIRGALAQLDPAATVTLVDPLASMARWPFSALGAAYPRVVERLPWLWGAGFQLTDTPRRARALQDAAWPMLKASLGVLAAQGTPDAILSTHPLLTAPLRRVFPTVPIAVVVTDLVSGHASWYDPGADVVVVPTREARTRAVAAGIDPGRVVTAGVPVGEGFIAQPGERGALLERLGWAHDRPTVLLAGGGDGVGPLESLAIAIDRAFLPADIAIVAGRNAALAGRLRARDWLSRVHVYDFVSNFDELLRAASVLVTKAGPGTISEACASGCPLVLSGAIPGQETGNVSYVTSAGAGVWAPSPIAVTAALHAWLVGRDAPAALRRASTAAMKLARPGAALHVAELALQLVRMGARRADMDARTGHSAAA